MSDSSVVGDGDGDVAARFDDRIQGAHVRSAQSHKCPTMLQKFWTNRSPGQRSPATGRVESGCTILARRGHMGDVIRGAVLFVAAALSVASAAPWKGAPQETSAEETTTEKASGSVASGSVSAVPNNCQQLTFYPQQGIAKVDGGTVFTSQEEVNDFCGREADESDVPRINSSGPRITPTTGCVKGCRCGNTCIDCSKRCHK
jgi:hypothetical protein